MQARDTMGLRRFGAVNWIGLDALYRREVRRFTGIWTQTILAPVATSVLFMAVFWLAFGEQRGDVHGTGFAAFLAPGIVMMSVIQNAFANTSSSIIVAKVQGNIVDTLCALAAGIIVFPASGVGIEHPMWLVAFGLAASVMLSLFGVLAGVYAEKFDQMAAVTNFFITPMSFLSGTFYSIKALPEPFLTLSHANPFFYLIDGFRYGAIGQSDTSPVTGLAVVVAMNVVLAAIAWRWLKAGYRLKS